MKKNRVFQALLFVGLAAMCITGCGGTTDDAKANEEVNMPDSVDDDIVVTENDAADGDESIVTGDSSEEESSVEATDEVTEEEISFEGRSLSILGDSISTYEGYIPYGLAVFYPAHGDVTDVSQTWWMRLLDDTGMELCSNGSSSGGTCIGDSLSADEPKYGCSDYRISLLTGEQGKMPDVIIVYMGTNDLILMTPMGDNDGTKLVEEGMVENFSDAYTMILDKLESNYPDAQIYCCTLAQVGGWGTDTPYVAMTNGFGFTSEDYSKQIEIIAANKGIPVIDLYHCGIEIDNLQETSTDGVHPTPTGMEYIERAVLKGMGITPDR